MFYSSSTCGFYSTEIHGTAMPTDVIEISDADHAALLTAQGAGQRIITSDNGAPTAAAPPAPTLVQARSTQIDAVRTAYASACEAPVQARGTEWNGGFDSAIKLDAAMRLAQAAGAPGVTFFDIANKDHMLDFGQALQVVIAVAADYQSKLARKQALLTAIAQAPTVQDALALKW